MKNLKKIAALVVVLAMALSSVAFAAFSDVDATSSYAEAINVMSALGIINGYEDGTFGPEKTITRAEFTTMLVNAMGMDNVGTVNTQFSDVTSNHWASGYISAGVAQGFINGYDATTFGPDDEVTYEQAVKMLICAVGYTPKFQIVKKNADGTTTRELDPSAYPSAYLAEANTAGVTAGVNQKVGDKASRQVVAKLVYNTLTTKMMEQTSFGSDPEWSVPTNNYKTLLTDYLGVDKVEATVAAVSFDPTTAKKVTIDPTKVVEAYEEEDYYNYYGTTAQTLKTVNALYDETKVAPNDNKGYSCVMYLDNKADDATVLAMFPKTGRNVTLTLTKDQFADQKLDSNGDIADTSKLSYYKNNDNDSSTLTAKLQKPSGTDTATFKVYENKSTSDITTSFFTEFAKCDNSDYTAVELIDNDNDGDYDIAFATTYKSMVVGEINTRTYKITQDGESNGLQKSVTLDPESDDTVYEIVDANGNVLAFEDIVAGDILNVFESTDGTYKHLKVMVTKDTISGTVNAYDKSEGKYSIGGTYYKNLASLDIGDAGTFYVDAYGVILKAELDASSRTFGYVFNAAVDTADFEDEAALVILDQTGKFVTYYFAKNNAIDKVAYTKDTLLDTTGSTTVVKGVLSGLVGEIVAYEVNGSGEITDIYTEAGTTQTVNGAPVKNGIETLNNGKYSVKDYSVSGTNYKGSTQAIAGGFITEEVPMWACKTATTSSTKTDYSIAYSSAFADAETYKVKAIIDTVNNNNIVAAIVYDMTALADPETPVMYVTGVGSSKTEDGDNATTLTGMVNGEEASIMVTDDTDIYRTDKVTKYARANLTKGDVVQYTGADVASGLTVVLTAAELADPAKIKSSDYAKQGEKKSDYLAYQGSDLTKDEESANGWLYAEKVAKYKNNVVTWADSANNTLRVAITVPSMLYRPTANKVYATEDIDASILETNDSWIDTKVKDASGAEVLDGNDDYLVVYEYDGTILAAIIVDMTGDTEF
ncbi:MAG: S-layer homology domain-containing protein [Clostridia bacterium]|nr:S-layer homology domain-containing protein [Clostridia bacterium]